MKTRHAIYRVVAVAASSLFLCLFYLPDLVRILGHPNGDWGFFTDGRIVTTVAAGSGAARAGLRPGDRIDISHLPDKQRGALFGGLAMTPGETMTIGVFRNGRYRPVTLHSVPESTAAALIVIRVLSFLVPLVVGIALLLLRPSRITWGFYLFSLAAGGVPPTSVAAYRIFPWPTIFFWVSGLNFIISVLCMTGLVLFAVSLSRRPLAGWRLAAVVCTAAIGIVEWLPTPVLHLPFGIPVVNFVGDLLKAAIALLCLFDAFLHVAPQLRQRLYWIAAGFLFWIAVDVTDILFWPQYEPYALHTALDAAAVLFPLAVAYAIFRERVVDINFVVSRTLVYGILTAGVIALFALIDLFLSKSIEASRISLPVDIVVALGLGFFFHNMHNQVDGAVDRFVFRKRHLAETRMARAAKAVVHVEDPAAVGEYITRLPVEVLELTGAALYVQREGSYVLQECAGWQTPPPGAIPGSDPLVAFISAELACVRVSDVPLRQPVSDPHDAPILAVPLVFRRELAGFVLYGAHSDGADLDADDERDLVPLVNNAAVTYDHLEAQALREELRRLRTVHASGVI